MRSRVSQFIGWFTALAVLPMSFVWAVEFSADLYQTDGQGNEMTGRIYVAEDAIRNEMEHSGQQMVQIVNTDTGHSYMLMPAQKAYTEQRISAASEKRQEEINPCAGMQGVQCRKLGVETVNGRKTEKWEVVGQHQGQTMRIVQWIDVERKMPIKQEMPNNAVMNMRMLGKETLNGRTVEKWEVVTQQGSSAPQKAYQWYDPELNVAIREEYPGGAVRELRNIDVGPQPDRLFEVPEGYREMTMPTPQEQPQQR